MEGLAPQNPWFLLQSAFVSRELDVYQDFNPNTDRREIEITGSTGSSLLIGHVKHEDGNLATATTQSALISNRPDVLKIIQTSSSLT